MRAADADGFATGDNPVMGGIVPGHLVTCADLPASLWPEASIEIGPEYPRP